MTATREEILAMARSEIIKLFGVHDPRLQEGLISFFYLAYAAGQRDMQERAAKECEKDNGMIYTADRAGIIGAAHAECAAAIRNLEVE